jgi:hypothetical protein
MVASKQKIDVSCLHYADDRNKGDVVHATVI